MLSVSRFAYEASTTKSCFVGPFAYANPALTSFVCFAGFHPHKCILGLMKRPVDLLCFEGTCYHEISDKEEEKDSVIRHTHEVGFESAGIRTCTVYHKQYVGVPCDTLDKAHEEATKNC